MAFGGWHPGGPGGGKPGYRRSAPPRRRHKTDGMVVPVPDPCALHCPPAKTFDAQLNRCSDRPGNRTHLEALRYFDAVLCDRLAIDENGHLVYSAVILGNYEARVETAVGVDIEFTER